MIIRPGAKFIINDVRYSLKHSGLQALKPPLSKFREPSGLTDVWLPVR